MSYFPSIEIFTAFSACLEYNVAIYSLNMYLTCMTVEILCRALHKNHNFLSQILSYFSPFDLHFYSISCFSGAKLCHLKEEWLDIWYANLLQYLKVQCLRIVTLPCAVLDLFPAPTGRLNGECVGLTTWWLWVRSLVEATFLSGIFLPLTSAETCEKSSRWLW